MNIYLKSGNDGASREGESEYWEWTNTTQNWRSEWKLKIVNYIIKTDSCLFLNQTNLLCWCSCGCCYYSFCYAYYIRGLCSFFLFPNAKYKIVSHFPLQPDAARYESECELKTAFYDETAHRVKYVFIHENRALSLAIFRSSSLFVRQWTILTSIHWNQLRVFFALLFSQTTVMPYALHILLSVLVIYLCARCMNKRQRVCIIINFHFLRMTHKLFSWMPRLCTSSTYPHAHTLSHMYIAYDDLSFFMKMSKFISEKFMTCINMKTLKLRSEWKGDQEREKGRRWKNN